MGNGKANTTIKVWDPELLAKGDLGVPFSICKRTFKPSRVRNVNRLA